MIDRSIHDALLSDAWLEGGPGAAAIGRNVDRMLDATDTGLTLDTMTRAATALGFRVKVDLVAALPATRTSCHTHEP